MYDFLKGAVAWRTLYIYGFPVAVLLHMSMYAYHTTLEAINLAMDKAQNERGKALKTMPFEDNYALFEEFLQNPESTALDELAVRVRCDQELCDLQSDNLAGRLDNLKAFNSDGVRRDVKAAVDLCISTAHGHDEFLDYPELMKVCALWGRLLNYNLDESYEVVNRINGFTDDLGIEPLANIEEAVQYALSFLFASPWISNSNIFDPETDIVRRCRGTAPDYSPYEWAPPGDGELKRAMSTQGPWNHFVTMMDRFFKSLSEVQSIRSKLEIVDRNVEVEFPSDSESSSDDEHLINDKERMGAEEKGNKSAIESTKSVRLRGTCEEELYLHEQILENIHAVLSCARFRALLKLYIETLGEETNAQIIKHSEQVSTDAQNVDNVDGKSHPRKKRRLQRVAKRSEDRLDLLSSQLDQLGEFYEMLTSSDTLPSLHKMEETLLSINWVPDWPITFDMTPQHPPEGAWNHAWTPKMADESSESDEDSEEEDEEEDESDEGSEEEDEEEEI